MMQSKLKLKGKMLLGYSFPIVICMGTFSLVYLTAHKVFETFKEVERVQNVLIQANDMSTATQAMISNLRGQVVDANQGFDSVYQENSKNAKSAAKQLEVLIKLPEQKERLAQMLEANENYDLYANQVVQLLKQGKKTEAINLFKTGKGTQDSRKFESLSTEFKNVEESLLKQETKEAKDSLNFLLIAILIGFLLLVFLAITIALLITSGITSSINEATKAITSSATEIAVTVEQQERAATHQAAAVQQTTTTMDELGYSSKQSAEQAEVAATGAKQVLILAETGMQTVEHTLEDMATLREKVEAIAQQILDLREQTGIIGKVSDLVSDLAKQTNMLALNAAIEAVRAGDNGKGFAVVAGEIRKLAEESKKSADKINVLVEHIQTTIHSTVTVTVEGTQKVETGVKTVQETAETFADVAEAVKNVVDSSQQISMTAKQQAIAIQQVVDAMNSINQGSAQTASGIIQTKIGTQKLNDAAIHLQAVV